MLILTGIFLIIGIIGTYKGGHIMDFQKKWLNVKLDLMSGISTATIALPQNMAYALIIGISPIYGIYASIYSMIFASIFNDSKYLIVGPTNMMAVAIASSLKEFRGNQYLEYILLTTLLIGLFQYLLVKIKLEALIKYISHPVIVALSNGAAILILLSQLENITGVPVNGNNIITKTLSFVNHLDAFDYLTFSVAVFSLLVILLIKKLKPKWPEYLLTLIIMTCLTYVTGLSAQLPLIGEIPNQLLDFHLPQVDFNMIQAVYTKAFSIALLGLIQTMAVLQAVSLTKKVAIDYKQDFKSQGLTNFFTSFFSGFAISASFSNTFANVNAGAKSKKSLLFCALTIIISISFLRPILSYIPIPVLASLILNAALSILDYQAIKVNFNSTKGDAIMFIITFLGTLLLPKLDHAIYLGVFTSFAIILKVSEVANIELLLNLGEKETFDLKEFDLEKTSIDMDKQKARIININGNLHFSTATHLETQLKEYYEPKTNYIIRLRNVNRIDITIVNVFKDFIKRIYKKNGYVVFTGVNNQIYNLFKQLKMIDLIGEENIYQQQSKYLASTKKAYRSFKKRE